MAKLRAVVIGLADAGREICAAAVSEPTLELVGVADRDSGLARESGEALCVAAYEDCRSAIVESKAEVVLMALPPYQRPELLRCAAEQGAAVLLAPPPLATFESLVEFAGLFASVKVPLCVARPWQAEPAFARLADVHGLAGHIFSAHVNVLSPVGDLSGWRGDSSKAQGGALLNDAYEQLDAIIAIFGAPDEVYTVLSSNTVPGECRNYDTEDAATVMIRFSGDRAATLNCRRMGLESYWRYRLHGTRATVLMTPSKLSVREIAGGDPLISEVRTRNRFSPVVTTFGVALAAGLGKPPSPVDEHRITMAVLQTAYLSARTRQPESPARLYQMVTGEELAA